jgi:hypothetical protein
MTRPVYFPPDTPRGEAETFALFLGRMGEPPLYPAPPQGRLTIRLLCLPTWTAACAVRAASLGIGFRVQAVELDGEAGFEVGGVARETRRELTWDEAARLRELWDYLRFWSLGADDPEADDVFDGTTYLLEAAEAGRYHRVWRDDLERGSTFAEFAELLQRLAGLPSR